MILLAWVPAQAQVMILSVRSVDHLLKDVKLTLKSLGMEDRVQQLEVLLGSVGGDQLKGLDPKRPLGAFLSDFQQQGDAPPLVIFLPVTKAEEFLDILSQAGVSASKPQDGIYTLDTPLGVPLYLKFEHAYAFAALEEDLLKRKLSDPSQFLPEAHKKNLIALTGRLDKIPVEQKRQALDSLEEQLKEALARQENETEEQHRLRSAITKGMFDFMTMLLEDGQNLSLSLNVGSKGEHLSLEIETAGASGSELAKRIREFGPGGVTAPVHLEVALGKVMTMFAPRDPEARQELSKLLGNDAKGKDTLKLTFSGGDSARIRLEVGMAALRILALLAEQQSQN
jgi:hypothetical protein